MTTAELVAEFEVLAARYVASLQEQGRGNFWGVLAERAAEHGIRMTIDTETFEIGFEDYYPRAELVGA